MKATILIAVSLLFFPLVFISCSNGGLTKTEAKKQLDEYLNKETPPAILVYNKAPNNPSFQNALSDLRNAGYIEYATSPADWNGMQMMETKITFLDKGKPFILGQQDELGVVRYRIKAGVYESEVAAIAEPAPEDGAMGCNVECKTTFIPNELYTLFTKIPIDAGLIMTDGDNINRIVSTSKHRFIKTQDGWKLKNN